jgi:ABC-type glutathione transport system ATPase component
MKNTGTLTVLKNISFTFEDNHISSLIGESGSGKSTLSRLLTYIEKPTSGEIYIDNRQLSRLSNRQLRRMRANVQMVLQNASSALDSRQKVYDIIAESIRNLTNINRSDEKKYIENMMEKVELSNKVLYAYPNELSGGQQKRVCIARAMSVSPRFIVFDESVSGLDVIVRKKVLDLLLRLQKEYKSTYLFITHDIDVAIYMSRDILVMKDGDIVEHVPKLESYKDFEHEYSKMLIKSQLPQNQ